VNRRDWWVYTERKRGKSLTEIGSVLGVTHTRVRQIVTRVDRFLLEQPNRVARDGPGWQPPPDRYRCQAMTQDGDRCKMPAEPYGGDGLCWNHRYQVRHGRWPSADDA
jgi:hypothetical protein